MATHRSSNAFVCVVLLTACGGGLPQPRIPSDQSEAGSVHASVVSVAPWSKYVTALRPKFPMTGKDALAKVLPLTSFERTSALDKFSFRGSVSTATSTLTPTAPSGDHPSVAGGLADPFAPQVEPMVQYQAALALFQEVQILNRYVEDAAFRGDYEPYVVRLQLTVLPLSRYQPYDTFTTVSFFGAESFPSNDGVKRKAEDERPLWEIERELRALVQNPPGGSTPSETPANIEDFRRRRVRMRVPQVIPLLVTDSLESGRGEIATESIREFALALGLTQGGGKAGLDLGQLRKLARSVVGRDLNSLFTIARISDNTIRVRLGAFHTPTAQDGAQFAMVPKNYWVTAILLVPRPPMDPKTRYGDIVVSAKSTFVHATKGTSVPETPREKDDAALRKVVLAHCSRVAPDQAPKVAREMLRYAHRNDYQSFRTLAVDCRKLRTLWVTLVGLSSLSSYATTSFDLPPVPRIGFPTNDVVLFDDGKKKSTVVVRDGRALAADRISATLYVDRSKNNLLPLLAESITTSEDGTTATLVFPSLKALRLPTGNLEMEVRLRRAAWDYSPVPPSIKTKVHHIDRPEPSTPPKPGFAMKTAVTKLVPKNGAAKLIVYFDIATETRAGSKVPVTDKISFAIRGAGVGRLSLHLGPDGAFEQTTKGIVIKESCAVEVPLQNVPKKAKVILVAKNEKTKVAHSDITLEVAE